MYISYSGLYLPKYSPWTPDFNLAISSIRSGGLIFHFSHEPLPLELTMKSQIFEEVDDSKEKLSLDTLMLIFIIWFFGMVTGVVVLWIEVIVYNNHINSKLIKL